MKNYHLHLRGFVGGYDFDSRHVQNVLDAHAGERVDVLIDSLGGSVATALTIASAFRNHGDVHVHFVGMNASAATIASMGAKEITMDSSAMYLVHKCSAEFFQWASLNADQLEKQIEDLSQLKTDLEKIDANVSALYAKRCGKTPEELLDLMKVGGWLNAEEAQTWGFVDEITDEDEDEAPVLTDAVASAMAAVGMPIPNIPVQESSQFQKLIAAITEFFKSGKRNEPEAMQVNQPKPEITMKQFPLLAAVLLMADAAIQLEDGKFSADEKQLELIEAALKEAADKQKSLSDEATATKQSLDAKDADIQAKDQEIASLKAQIEELNKQPGDSTTHPINDGAAQESTPIDDFCARLKSAQKLYDMA